MKVKWLNMFFRLLFILMIFYYPSQLLGQGVDTSSIVFKAKLLTLSRYGELSRDDLDLFLDEQKVTLLNSPSSNLLFLKVKSSYYNLEGIKVLGECTFYLAFNIAKNAYYRLGGFDSVDVSDFFNDLLPEDASIYSIEFLETSDIDFSCIMEYMELSEKKKRKRRYPCYEACNDVFSREIIISTEKNR